MPSTTESATRVPKTLGGTPWHGPARYALFVEFPSTPSPGDPTSVDRYVGRVAQTNDLAAIPRLIADDLRAMGDTFGGLIEASPTRGRTYRVFEISATELDTAAILRRHCSKPARK